jgi:hypothetical protein
MEKPPPLRAVDKTNETMKKKKPTEKKLGNPRPGALK